MTNFWQKITILTDAFELGEEENIMRQHSGDAGALVVFQGMVREFDHGMDDQRVVALFLEHFPKVTESEIERIVHEAKQRWSLTAVRVLHRVGTLQANEAIVLVMVASRHRHESFAAAEFIMDYLKTQAPFWKRELRADGSQKWIESKHSDVAASQRWQA